MLSIKNLHVEVDGKEIIRGLDLNVNPGEVHAIMGPNGSGKSTLAHVLAGRDGYEVISGEVLYDGENLLDMPAEDRAREGVFLGFQYPVEIPGVNNTYFLKAALNAARKHRGEDELDAMDFMKLVKEKLEILHIDDSLLQRPVNVGFSGGEKKRLRDVARGVNELRNDDRAIVLVTHYQRLLNYITPDFVHILSDGRIVKSGGRELALEVEEEGYTQLRRKAAPA
jgi:Fe-S cluster assembly ATP-binding protein